MTPTLAKSRPFTLRISGACLTGGPKPASPRALRLAGPFPDAKHSVCAGHASLDSTRMFGLEDSLPAEGSASALMKAASEVTRAEFSSYAILAACAVMQGVLCALLMGDLPSNLLRTIAILLK